MKKSNISRCLRVSSLVVCLCLLCALAGCKPRAARVTLFFTAQTHGRLTHCGCFTGQYGGVARLKTALGTPSLAGAFGVDLGDAIEGNEDFHLMKFRQVAGACKDMGYAAMNIGHREATLPADELRALAADSPVPLISANLLDRATGKPLLPGWTVIERGGRRIALVGVLDSVGLEDTLGEGLAVERIETCLARILPEVKRDADVLVLLAFTDEATLTAIARQFYEFRVILGGRVSQPAQALVRENRSLIYYTANEAKSFGSLELVFGEDGTIEPGSHEITLLTDKIPQDPGILARLESYRNEVRRTRLAIDDPSHEDSSQVPGTRTIATFAGTEACLGCHPGAARVWKQSEHANAFASLEKARADADPSCIGCHTMGFGAADGYRREFGAAKLTNVGCESCHGPGSTHVSQRQGEGPVTFHFRPLGAGDCMKCHHGEFSPPFNWEKLWPVVRHGKD
jgi:hypothetical protein